MVYAHIDWLPFLGEFGQGLQDDGDDCVVKVLSHGHGPELLYIAGTVLIRWAW